MQLTKAENIRLKTNIPDRDRTHGKDQAAEYIQNEIVEKGRWPMKYTEIANESGWSRQHITNTLSDYFENADNSTNDRMLSTNSDGNTVVEGVAGRIEIEVPENVDVQTYLRGWVAGYMEGIK